MKTAAVAFVVWGIAACGAVSGFDSTPKVDPSAFPSVAELNGLVPVKVCSKLVVRVTALADGHAYEPAEIPLCFAYREAIAPVACQDLYCRLTTKTPHPFVRVETPHYGFEAGLATWTGFANPEGAYSQPPGARLSMSVRLGSAWAFRLSKIFAAESAALPVALGALVVPDQLGSEMDLVVGAAWQDRGAPVVYDTERRGTDEQWGLHAIGYDAASQELDVAVESKFDHFEY